MVAPRLFTLEVENTIPPIFQIIILDNYEILKNASIKKRKAYVIGNIGNVLRQMGRPKEALESPKKAHEIAKDLEYQLGNEG